jgi:hypothetical protein
MNPFLRPIASALLFIALAACGGGGNGNDNPPPPPPSPPTGLTYPAPPAYLVNTAIAPLNPAVSGSVTAYSISPALPAGLTLNTSSGVISGTPTVVSPPTSYQVVASNAGGNTSATISIRVDDAPPSFSYPRASYAFSTNVPVTSVTPASNGGAVTSWSVSPALPAGLALNATTGAITGTPNQITPAATYVVTAQNTGGTDTFDLSIRVQTEALLELGHVHQVVDIQQTATRLLSRDTNWNISLFDALTGRKLMHTAANSGAGSTDQRMWMCDDVAIVHNAPNLDVRSTADGSLSNSIDVGVMLVSVASDCSYVWGANEDEFRVWSSTGQLLFSRANGGYRSAKIIGLPGEIRVAGGPAAATGVETITVPGNVSTIAPGTFDGVLLKWFSDGSHFLTTAGNSLWVYSPDVVQQDFRQPGTLEGLDGRGNRFWTFAGNTLNVYAVGASSMPLVTHAFGGANGRIVADRNLLAFVNGNNSVSIIDIAPATPTRTDRALPIDAVSFGGASTTDFAVGNGVGVMIGEPPAGGGDPLMYSLGPIRALAGGTEFVALVTALETTRIYDTDSRELEQELDLNPSLIEMSADGTVIAKFFPDSVLSGWGQLNVYSLPSMSVLSTYDFQAGQSLIQFKLSDSGEFLSYGTTTGVPDEYTRTVARVNGSQLYSDTVIGWIDYLPFPLPQVSPDGSTIALPPVATGPTAGTDIYRNGGLLTTLIGFPNVWLRDDRIVMNRGSQVDDRWSWSEGACRIVELGGAIIDCVGPATAYPLGLEVASETSGYLRGTNTIRDFHTGEIIWHSGQPITDALGTLAGDWVVFLSTTLVRIEHR